MKTTIKKLPFPKNTTKIAAYLLPDGIGFAVTVGVSLGESTKYLQGRAVLRLPKCLPSSCDVNWYFECGSWYLDANEVLNIVGIQHYDKAYSEDGSLAKKLGGRGEMLVIKFKKGHSLSGVAFPDHIRFGDVYKTGFLCKSCDDWLTSSEATLFDIGGER